MINDFERQSFCILGLPFDAINLQEAVETVKFAASYNARLFLSTPNLNFLISSQSDPEFRQSVINSELSIVDGMPIVWIAKLLGYPITERVAGSDLFEHLSDHKASEEPIKIFFFGGPDGMAEQACKTLNKSDKGLICSGFFSPGFGTVEEMSTAEIINNINNASANFLLVALGAKKGQEWIEYNRSKLNVQIISHLGAVVNFVAGNVKRAPVFFQKTGLEWVWRILNEPNLWKRYFFDGLVFVRLFIFRVLPYVFWKKLTKKPSDLTTVSYAVEDHMNTILIKIKGQCLYQTIDPLRKVFREVSDRKKPIHLDLTEVSNIDGGFIGLCLMLQKHLAVNDQSLTLSGLNKNIRRIFYWNCAEFLL